VTKKRHYLSETIQSGPHAVREADKARTRLLAQVDERRNPRTRATMNHLLDRWLEVLDVDVSTRRGYVSKIETHIRPLLGPTPVAKANDVEAVESFYAVLRRCREHSASRRRTGDHVCKGLRRHPESHNRSRTSGAATQGLPGRKARRFRPSSPMRQWPGSSCTRAWRNFTTALCAKIS
jgi:hypothetical protein